MKALARELIRRGHRATFVGIADAEPLAAESGIGFAVVGRESHPAGRLARILARMTSVTGIRGLTGIVRDVTETTAMLVRDLPPLLPAIGADAILCDGTEAAGGLVGAGLGLPVVTVSNALPLNREPGIPPPFLGWRHDPSIWGIERNRGGYRVADWIMRGHEAVITAAGDQWRLGPRRTVADCLSPLAQVSQTVAGLDFPRRELPAHFHHVGPLRDPAGGSTSGFSRPADDGRPLVYASLGTLGGGRLHTFRRIAEAARRLDVRLVVAHGGRLDERQAASLPGNPSVHAFVPQDEVLVSASGAILNCGLNTVVDALARSVPIVALPIAFEQDAIASRIAFSGVGRRVSRLGATAGRIARALDGVLREPSYRVAAGRLAGEIAGAGGVLAAADIVDEVLRTGRPVTREIAATLAARRRAAPPRPVGLLARKPM